MANYIPKIQWNEQSIIGDTTSGNPTITNITNTSLIQVGMRSTSAVFPSTATVLSKTSTSVTMTANALATETSEGFNFLHEIEFVYPVNGRPNETFEPNQTVSTSVSGQRQIQTNHILAKLKMTFRFIEPLVYARIRDVFYFQWAGLGKEFKFFESKDESAFRVYELDLFPLSPEREIAKGNDFLYKFDITIRRIVQ
jgi:hypothetical protein